VEGCCECDDQPSGSGATELVEERNALKQNLLQYSIKRTKLYSPIPYVTIADFGLRNTVVDSTKYVESSNLYFIVS
jgi:hypothetical protein